jgi:hypothetical protein
MIRVASVRYSNSKLYKLSVDGNVKIIRAVSVKLGKFREVKMIRTILAKLIKFKSRELSVDGGKNWSALN